MQVLQLSEIKFYVNRCIRISKILTFLLRNKKYCATIRSILIKQVGIIKFGREIHEFTYKSSNETISAK